jgi:rubrerythrin
MKDVEQHADAASPYECLQCGGVTVAEDNPGSCPDCGGEMRNRRTPLE